MQGKTLTSLQKAKFIKSLVKTGGNVSRACITIKCARPTAYDHKKNDPVFSAEWDEALEHGVDELEQEARRRAFEGNDKPVYQGGQMVGYIREYSDTLTIFMLKGRRPDVYKDKMDVNTNVQGSLDLNIQEAIDKIYDEPDND